MQKIVLCVVVNYLINNMFKKVKVSSQKPPEWILQAVKDKFDVDWESNIVFAYDGQIMTNGGIVTEDLVAHETTHFDQQEKVGGSDNWWRKYLEDEKFRFEQELEAYRNQYQFIKMISRDQKFINNNLAFFAEALSGPIYGNMVSKDVAYNLILNYN